MGTVTVTYTAPFVWPAEGPLTSSMGPEHPNGIDIGLDAGGSLVVRAASAGTVLEAGGSNDEPLGLSVVIDHGNGITTTYGHLAKLLVEAGEFVDTSDQIGVGGSTGIADGVHLHFEVRLDGQTVDPEDVLPTGEPATDEQVAVADCKGDGLSLAAGARASLDVSGLLRRDEQVVEARALALAGGDTFDGAVQSPREVLIGTRLDFTGPVRQEAYRLELTIDSPGGNRALTCPLTVQHRSVPTTFYVRAASPGDGEGHMAPTPEPTPSPTPTSSVEPHYSGPVVANPTVAPPTYSGADGESPGVSEPVFVAPIVSSR